MEESSPVLSADAGIDLVSKCGIVETPLIVGGESAAEMEFPHMVMERHARLTNVVTIVIDFRSRLDTHCPKKILPGNVAVRATLRLIAQQKICICPSN